MLKFKCLIEKLLLVFINALFEKYLKLLFCLGFRNTSISCSIFLDQIISLGMKVVNNKILCGLSIYYENLFFGKICPYTLKNSAFR